MNDAPHNVVAVLDRDFPEVRVRREVQRSPHPDRPGAGGEAASSAESGDRGPAGARWPTMDGASGPTHSRRNRLPSLAVISAIVAHCCTGCGGSAPAPSPLPGKTAPSPESAKTTLGPSTASNQSGPPPLDPLTVSTETPLVAEVVRVFNKAREQGGLPALRINPELKAIARAQLQAEVEAQPVMMKGAPRKKAKGPVMPVAERAEKLGYRFGTLKEITNLAAGPAVAVLTDCLRNPDHEYHKVAFGDWTDFAVAEGRDGRGLPFLSVVFGTLGPAQGNEASGASKDPRGTSPKAKEAVPKGPR